VTNVDSEPPINPLDTRVDPLDTRVAAESVDENHAMSRSSRLAMAAAGLVVAAVAAPMAAWMTFTPTGNRWSQVVDDTQTGVTGVWRALQLGYAYLLIPALLLLFAVLLILAYHQSPTAAWVFGAVALFSNLTVQFVKIAPLGIEQSSTALDPLSGHVGVAAGVCLGWLLVAPAPWRWRSAAAAAVILVAVSTGVMTAGWHSPFQVLCPLLMATGWATVGGAVQSQRVTGRQSEVSHDTRHGVAATLSGLLVVAVTTALLLRFPASMLQVGAAPVALAAVWTAGWCAAAVGVITLVASRQVAMPRAARLLRRTTPRIETADRR
jgi:hypothetical protein